MAFKRKRSPDSSIITTPQIEYEFVEDICNKDGISFYDLLYNKRREYSSIVRIAYNRVYDFYKTHDENEKIYVYEEIVKSGKYNFQYLDACEQNTPISDGELLYKTRKSLGLTKPAVFGGKKNFSKLHDGKISLSDWRNLRLRQYKFMGSAYDNGNRKFNLRDLDKGFITWKPDRNHNFLLKISGKIRQNLLQKFNLIAELARNCLSPITVSLTDKHIQFSYDCIQDKPEEKDYTGRYAGFDLNPCHIAFSIFNEDESRFKSFDYNLKDLMLMKCDNTYAKNKIKNELSELAKHISITLKQYKVNTVYIENLNIKPKNIGKGRGLNKLINNRWNRDFFATQLKKRCLQLGIKVREVYAGYSSTIGNLLNYNLPDPIASSCEIARRGHDRFYKNIVKGYAFPVFDINALQRQWKELAENCIDVEHPEKQPWIELHKKIKKSKMIYRVPWSVLPKSEQVFQEMMSHKSFISFIMVS